MKKLTPASGTKTIKIIPRDYVGDLTLKLRDRSRNKLFSVDTTSVTTDGNFTQISWEHDTSPLYLVEGRQYDLSVIDTGDNVIYRDSVFVTSQQIDQDEDVTYDINKDVYTSYTGNDNSFIILDD
jgi:hypothetical protein